MASRHDFTLHIDTHRCTGCGWCVAACPLDLLSLSTVDRRKTSTLHNTKICTGCRQCEAKCLFGAIEVRFKRPVAGIHGEPYVQSRHAGC
ncbi:MAG: ferredoxin family protein [Betaproteobacteria bacterium]|nr:ferredoxin family protein [Betaproteobacteria bacterium]